jgi:hypothetical protein
VSTKDTPFGDELPARLSPASVAARTSQQTSRGKQFVRGPIPMAWLEMAADLPGKALAVGVLLWFRRGFNPSSTEPLTVTPTLLARFGVSRKAGAAAVRRLDEAGLVTAEFSRGRCPRVMLRVPSEADEVPSTATTKVTR